MNNYAFFWKALDTQIPSRYRYPLAVLSLMADDNLECYPGRAFLSKKLGISETEISRVTSWLKKQGFIEIRPGRVYRANTYYLKFLRPAPELLRAEEFLETADGKVTQFVAHLREAL